MANDIELYLISGFLGSGKTSFLKHVLTALPEGRVGVIVNEFGSVGIDGTVLNRDGMKLVEINNGSIFCACLKGGFIRTLAAFLEQPVDYLFVEASGLADPDNMAVYLAQMEKNLQKKPHVTRRYRYCGGICVTDAVNFLDYADIFPVVDSQVQKSRLILLNKASDVSKETRDEVKTYIETLNPEACLVPTDHGKIDPGRLSEYLRGGEKVGDTLNTPTNRPDTFVLKTEAAATSQAVAAFSEQIADKTLRVKGFVPVDDGWLHLDHVAASLHFDRTRDVKNGCLVIISSSDVLTEESIRDCWEKTVGTQVIVAKD